MADERGRRFHWSIWIGVITAAGILLLAVVLFLPGGVGRPKLVLPVGEELELRLVAVLTKKNPVYDSRPMAAKVAEDLPVYFQVKLNKFIKLTGERFEQSLEQGAFVLLFKVGYQHGKASGRTAKEAEDDYLKLETKGKIPYLHIRYDEGSYSVMRGLSRMFSFSPGESIYSVGQSQVPVNLETLQLELVEMPKGWEGGNWAVEPLPKVVHSVSWPNPVHEPVVPLTAHKLPATITKGDLSVTLRQLVTNTKNPGRRRQLTPEFERAEGTLEKPCFGAAVIEVVEAGTSNSSYVLDDLEFYYGKSLVPYGPEGASVGQAGRTDKGTLYICGFEEDLHVLGQPVKVRVKLSNTSRSRADEARQVDVPLPKAEAISNVVTVPVWHGELQLRVGNQANFNRDFVLDTEDKLSVLVEGSVEGEVEIETIDLVGSQSRISLKNFRAGGNTRGNVLAANYDLKQLPKLQQDGSGLDNFSTVSLKLVAPRTSLSKVDFIVKPVEAGTQAAKGADKRN